MDIKYKWIKWALRDEKGYICGIHKDAPEEMKKEYYKWVIIHKGTHFKF